MLAREDLGEAPGALGDLPGLIQGALREAHFRDLPQSFDPARQLEG